MEIFSESLDSDHISLFFFGDNHHGNANHDDISEKRMVKHILETSKERLVKVIGMGDYIDCINTKDPRFSPSEIDQKYKISDLKDLPRKQSEYFYESIKSLENYFNYALVGNHEESFIKHGGFNVYDHICTSLLPNCKKLGFSGMVKFDCGTSSRASFVVCLTHGTGGGGFREGAKINNLFDIFRKFHADFYIMGHVHEVDTKHYDYIEISKSGKMKKVREWYGLSGCFLDTYKEGQRNYFEGHKGGLSHIGFLEARIDRCSDEWKTELIKHIF